MQQKYLGPRFSLTENNNNKKKKHNLFHAVPVYSHALKQHFSMHSEWVMEQ
jgi:hypothetical protein